MDRLFKIDFYPQDWLIDTAKLTPEERGIYIQILMMIYSNRGPIPDDEKHLANLCNCSSRKIRSIISSLVQKEFIQIFDAKITQKRAEYEMNIKRTHLENSSKGGLTTAEKRRASNKINGIASTDTTNPLHAPSPSPSPSPYPITPKPPLGFFESVSREDFEIREYLDDRAKAKAAENAPQWDADYLMNFYNLRIRNEEVEMPDNPAGAFIGWCKAFTKGKPPK